MNEILSNITHWAMLTFLLAAMLELGLGLTILQILAPLKMRLVVLSLLANFAVAPLLAIGIAKGLRLDQPFASGLLLLGLAPGAPFIPKVVQIARGNVAFATGLMVLLMIGTVLDLPLLLPRIIAGVKVDPWQIEKSLLLLMLLPLFSGLTIRTLVGDAPGRLLRALGLIANASGIIVLALILCLNVKSLVSVFGTGAIFGGALFIALLAASGWLLGGADRGTRAALGFGTPLRNVAAALIVGAENFKDPRVNVMVIVTALVSLIVLVPVAALVGRQRRIAPPSALQPSPLHS